MFLRIPILENDMLKPLYVDVETTGLDRRKHVIIDVAMISDPPVVDNKATHFSSLVALSQEEWDARDSDADKIHGHIWENFDNQPGRQQIEQELCSFVLQGKLTKENVRVYGHSPYVDLEFLKKDFPGLEFFGFPFYDYFDITEWAKDLIDWDYTFRPASLSAKSIAQALGVFGEREPHAALGGALLAQRNHTGIRKRFSEIREKMAFAAQKGIQIPDEIPVVQLSYGQHLYEFEEWASKNLWQRHPHNHLVFVNPQGFRWLFVSWQPSFLVRLNKLQD